jgi:hypothetical protein
MIEGWAVASMPQFSKAAGAQTADPSLAKKGTHTASRSGVFFIGNVTSMAGVLRIFAVLAMAIMPGGLFVLCAFMMCRLVTERLKLETGPARERFAKAWAHVHWRDVWSAAKSGL